MIWAIIGAIAGVALLAISRRRTRRRIAIDGLATSAFLGAILIGALLWIVFD